MINFRFKYRLNASSNYLNVALAYLFILFFCFCLVSGIMWRRGFIGMQNWRREQLFDDQQRVEVLEILWIWFTIF